MSVGVEPVLEMRGICKFFPGVKALEGVDLALFGGEVHALMGENGAGKSTLMKVLGGVHQPDQGDMVCKGQPYAPASPLEARSAGVGFVHQELKLTAHMTVAENICLGRLPTKGWGLIDKARLESQAQAALDELGVTISPHALVGRLSVAMQQMVEIAKAISLRSEILIMDEPTASLSARETQHLFEIVERLRAGGTAIVYISHRMEEVFQLCQRITVLRDGQSVGTWATGELDEPTLVKHMVGRELQEQFPARNANLGHELLRVEELEREGVFAGVSFSVKAGEVLGMGGLVGAGRTEIARCLAGADRRDAGKVYVDGNEVSPRHVRDGIEAGIGYITEDRKGQGLTLGLDVEENVTLASLRALSNGVWIHKKSSRDMASRWVEKLRVRTPTLAQTVKNLSGGNGGRDTLPLSVPVPKR